MTITRQIQEAISQSIDPQKAAVLQRFFKTRKGQYGEGDVFAGVAVPQQRKIAKAFYKKAGAADVEQLLKSPVHEHRLTALLMMVLQFEKATTAAEQKALVDLYLNNVDRIDNWDLVDSSAPYILGAYLFDRPKTLLYDFARSGSLWKQRIAIIATFYFIRQKRFDDTLAIAEILLQHPHDLIHKAVGWMLRETGNRHMEAVLPFLVEHYHYMPRTMLRYAIEKLEPRLKEQFMKGTI